LASEAKVCHPEHNYAGTLDAIALMKNGNLAIIDFKFAAHISADSYLQEAGYAACFEPYDILFKERIILRLPKTLEVDVWDAHKRAYHKEPNDIEPFYIPTDYEEDRDTFFACLIIKKWINKVT
jgi:hypothetical protein